MIIPSTRQSHSHWYIIWSNVNSIRSLANGRTIKNRRKKLNSKRTHDILSLTCFPSIHMYWLRSLVLTMRTCASLTKRIISTAVVVCFVCYVCASVSTDWCCVRIAWMLCDTEKSKIINLTKQKKKKEEEEEEEEKKTRTLKSLTATVLVAHSYKNYTLEIISARFLRMFSI